MKSGGLNEKSSSITVSLPEKNWNHVVFGWIVSSCV